MRPYHKGQLRAVVPSSGSKFLSIQNIVFDSNPFLVKYQSRHRLMHNHRRDKRVTDALKAAGYQITRAAITAVLMNMFQTATPIVAAAHARGEDLWDSLPRVQLELDWARNLPEAIFFELVVCFVEARYEWEKNPVYPFYHSELYNPAVCELVTFLKSIGDYGTNNGSWVLTDAVFFNELARGFSVDEDENEDEYVVMRDYNPDSNEFSDDNEDLKVADLIPPQGQMAIQQEEEDDDEEL
jgi:hypothetical protein